MRRRCQHTADRIGLLLAGDVFAAEQALLTVTVGNTLAAGTDTREIVTQREELYDDVWTWVRLLFQSDLYILDRILDLRRYGATVPALHTASPSGIGAIELPHGYIRSISVFIIHGHDRLAVLELKNFLFAKFPRVAPIVLAEDTLAAATIPEKLEIIADKASGAIALLTPDDFTVLENQTGTNAARSRQNVVLEIGWFWLG